MKALNAANVMSAVRDRVANDVDALCRVFAVPPNYGRFELDSILRELVEAGLIVRAGGPGYDTYEVNPDWYRIQRVLGIRLSKLGEGGSDSITVTPWFGKPAGIGEKLDVFVVMPFKDTLDGVYKEHIRKVAESIGVSIKRADDFFGAHDVMTDVWEAMNAARIVIADCTGRNPNVFYEIGMAHTLGKRVILITQNKKDVPFDLHDIRYIQYNYTPPGMKLFEENLLQSLKTELV